MCIRDRYELAIMLPRDDSDGFSLTVLSAGLSVLFSAVMGLLLLGARFLLKIELDWVIFLPFGIAVLGIYYSCNYWLNRNKQYNKLALNRVLPVSYTHLRVAEMMNIARATE